MNKRINISGNDLKNFRLDNNLTQKNIASITGLSNVTISNYEKYKTIPPAKQDNFFFVATIIMLLALKKKLKLNDEEYCIKLNISTEQYISYRAGTQIPIELYIKILLMLREYHSNLPITYSYDLLLHAALEKQNNKTIK